jgi:hypothetical protein
MGTADVIPWSSSIPLPGAVPVTPVFTINASVSGTPAGAGDNMDLEKGGVKYDQEKARYDLIPASAMDEVAQVYTFGANKYRDRNWEVGMRWGRVFAAIMRHAWAWMRGETYDPETGLHHMAHAAFGCLALIEFDFTGAGQDDRPYSAPVKE